MDPLYSALPGKPKEFTWCAHQAETSQWAKEPLTPIALLAFPSPAKSLLTTYDRELHAVHQATRHFNHFRDSDGPHNPRMRFHKAS